MPPVLLSTNSIMLFLPANFLNFQKILEQLLLQAIKKLDGLENGKENHLIYDFYFQVWQQLK